MADLSGFGSFGGGLAQGFMSTYGGLKRIQREDSEEKRKTEAHGQAMKLGKVQLRTAERADQQADIRQRIQDIAMQVQTGALSEADGLRRLASVHSAHPDGKQAFITNVNGQPYAVLGDENTRDSTLHPITGDGSTFMKAYQGLLSVLDPAYGQKQQELGIRSRDADSNATRAGAAVTTANASAENARTNAGLLPARQRLLGAQADYYGSGGRPYAAMANSRNFQPAGTLQDGTPVSYDAHRGIYVRADSGQPLSGEQLKLFQKITGERGITPIGSDGTFSMNGRIYVPNPDPRSPQRFIDATPGAGILDRLRSTGAPADGRPSISVPSPDFHRTSSGRNVIQRFLGLNARPDLGGGGMQSTPMFRDPLTGEGIDADTWRRKYGEEPPL